MTANVAALEITTDTAGVTAAAQAFGQLADATDKAGATISVTDQKIRGASGSLDALAKLTDGNTAATLRLEAAGRVYQSRVESVMALQATGQVSAAQAATMLDRLAVLYQQASDKAVAYGQSVEARFAGMASATAAATASMQSLSQVQQQINQATGVGSGTDYAARAADVAAYGNELDALRAKYNPLFAVSKQYEAELDAIARAQKVGAINTAEAQAATEKATDAFAKANAPLSSAGVSAGNAAFAMRQLGVQSVQAISGIATGQPVLMTLIQQGHQVGDVMLSTGTGFGVVGTAAKAAWGFITSPIGLVIAGVGAVGLAVTEVVGHSLALETESRSLSTVIAGVGRSAELSSGQLQKYVAALAQQGVSRADAAAISGTLSRNPALSAAQIGNVMSLAPDVAAALGSDAQTAAKQLGEALSGSYAATVKLDDALNFLTADQRTSIRTMLEHGDRIGAVAALSDDLHKKFDGLRKDSLGPLDQMLESVSGAWKRLQDGLSRSEMPSMQDAEAAATPGTNVGKAPSPAISTRDSFGATDSDTAAAQAEAKAVSELTQKLDNERRVLAASLPERAAVRAEIQAEQDIRSKGLSGISAELVKREAVATALATEGDARSQEIQALQRSATYAVALAAATDKGRDSALLSAAAAEAHEKAVTQAGVAELALANAILNRNAAQEAAKGAAQVQDLRDQVAASQAVAAATTAQQQHQADLTNTVEQTTRSMRAAAAVTTDPAVRAALEQQIALIGQLAPAWDKASAAARNARELVDDQNQLDVLAKQVSLLSASATEQARGVAELQEFQKLAKEQGADPLNLTEQQKQLIAYAGDIASATAALQQQRQLMDELANIATQAFDQVGQAIVNSFVQGTGAAVNWGNITRSIIASVAQEIVKLAILNPVLNSVLGGDRATLGSAVSALAGSGVSGASGGASGTSLLSTGSSLLSAGNTLSGGTLLQSLGITGEKGLLSSLGLGGNGGLLSGVNGFLNTPLTGASGIFGDLFGSQASAAAANTFLGAPDSFVAATGMGAPAGTAAGATLGGVLGGVGAGFTAGSLAGGLVQSSLNKTGPGPEIGAGIGAAALVAGAALAPETFGLSLLVAGLIGGTGGGLLGGLIGPHPPSPFSSTGISVGPDGLLQQGTSVAQIDANNGASVASDIQTLNATLQALNIAITTLGGIWQLGQNTPGGFQDPTKAADLASAFGGLRFGSPDTNVNSVLSGRSFADLGALQSVTAALEGFVNDVGASAGAADIPQFLASIAGVANADLPAQLTAMDAFVTQTVPALEKFNDTTGSLAQQIQSINDQFSTAIATAQHLGYAEDQLTAARDKAIQAANDNVTKQLFGEGVGWISRYLNAAATISGSPQDALQAQLFAFDQSAQQQRDALDQQLVGVYGDTIRGTAGYNDQLAALEKALGEERLAIISQSNSQIVQSQQQAAQQAEQAQQQAAQTGATAVTSIADYLRKFQLGSASPLSAQDQYSLASGQFNAVAGAAAAGDYNSISQFTTYADALATSAQALFGSGSGYVDAVNRIENAAAQIASVSPDTLTASVYQFEQRSSTQQLTDKLDSLIAAVNAVKQQLSQNALIPARLVG